MQKLLTVAMLAMVTVSVVLPGVEMRNRDHAPANNGYSKKCVFCNGTGFKGSFNCNQCKGTGRL